MYPEQIAKQAIAGRGLQIVDQNPTVEENIERKIAYHQSEIDRLTKSKEALGPLLSMRIGDIRQAMDY